MPEDDRQAREADPDGVDREIVRGGVRRSNDLVFIGSAPNIAAKLSALRILPTGRGITWSVYEYLHDWAKIGSNGNNMWTKTKKTLTGVEWDLYKSAGRGSIVVTVARVQPLDDLADRVVVHMERARLCHQRVMGLHPRDSDNPEPR